MSINDCKIISLPTIEDSRGKLTFMESINHIPFEIKRVFYLYAAPQGFSRGAHAHKILHQFLVAAAGSFEVTVNDGCSKKKFQLNSPCLGLYIPPLIWSDLNNFSSDVLCMVLASDFYNEEDYYRNYDDFVAAVGGMS